MKGELQMEWIDIEKKQPHFGETVLTATSKGVVRVRQFRFDAYAECGDGFGNKNAGYHPSDVILWMKWPEIPEGYLKISKSDYVKELQALRDELEELKEKLAYWTCWKK